MSIAGFYDKFYEKAKNSRAHAEFCERVYGKNFCQHGMADERQIGTLLEELALKKNSRVLDVGCGPGLLSDDIQRRTGCRLVGLDISPIAVRQAAALQHERLQFLAGNIERCPFAAGVFDAMLFIDTHYFIEDFASFLPGWISRLREKGKIAVFSDEGKGVEGLDESKTQPHETLIGKYLAARGISYEGIRLYEENAAHWRKKQQVLVEMKEAFEKENNQFIYQQRLGECTEHDRTLDGRYLFIIFKS